MKVLNPLISSVAIFFETVTTLSKIVNLGGRLRWGRSLILNNSFFEYIYHKMFWWVDQDFNRIFS
jgi:hypothetical protein